MWLFLTVNQPRFYFAATCFGQMKLNRAGDTSLLSRSNLPNANLIFQVVCVCVRGWEGKVI